MTNPIIAEVIRGSIVESRHRGSFAVADEQGKIVLEVGNTLTPVYPRSAIKALQCLPVIESGAADRFHLTDTEIALCCASHNGEPEHVRAARSILSKIGLDESCYECGAHWPSSSKAAFQVVREGGEALQVHNNCSGKHAGMLALAKYLDLGTHDYIKLEHPVQRAVAASIGKICDCDLSAAPVGVDGCSVPTWAIPLQNLATGFARLHTSIAGQRIILAVRANPFMVGGTDLFDTEIMTAIPRLFIKYGAEGVFCGCIPHAGLGFAVKTDDGAARAVQVATAAMLASLNVWSPAESAILKSFQQEKMQNWRNIHVGEVRASL